MRQVPVVGQTVTLDRRAGARFAAGPVRLRLTAPVEAYGVDRQVTSDVACAPWWLLTGWRLGTHDEPVILCMLPVRADGVQVDTPAPPLVHAGP